MTLTPERTGVVRSLTATDLPGVRALVERDPAVHCFMDARLRLAGVDPWRLGGDIWGFIEDGQVLSALYLGANLVPIETDARSRAAFADRLRMQGRRCSSFVGRAEEVLDLWRLLEPAWGPAREVRAAQPFLLLDTDASIAPEPKVRRVRENELDLLLPACIAMFTEEVGVSPTAGGSGSAYRARVAELVREGRALANFDEHGVVFKAEIGVATSDACQVQGVWVRPDLRGRGMSGPGMAAVVAYARAEIAPVVSLYVNDFNTAARKAYATTGFRQHEMFATVLF
jgi:uncharacterized protein